MIYSLMSVDFRILYWIQEHMRNAFLTPVFTCITILGNLGLVWILISVTLLFFKKTRTAGIICLIALADSFLVNNVILKNLVERARPFETYKAIVPLIAKPLDYSFPSGHTAASFACAGVLCRHFSKKTGAAFIILALLIGFSRLYLGVHYPSDVIAGGISGFLLSLLAERMYQTGYEFIKNRKGRK